MLIVIGILLTTGALSDPVLVQAFGFVNLIDSLQCVSNYQTFPTCTHVYGRGLFLVVVLCMGGWVLVTGGFLVKRN